MDLRHASRLSVLTLLGLGWALPSAGQSPWVSEPGEAATWMEALKVDFEGGPDFSFLSMTFYTGGRIRLSSQIDGVGELPLATSTVTTEGGAAISEATNGNPYVGIEWFPSDPVAVELGVRLPLSASPFRNTAARIGLSADVPDRGAAFVRDGLSFVVVPNLRIELGRETWARFRAGPTMLRSLSQDPRLPGTPAVENRWEFIGQYGAMVGHRAGVLRVLGGVSGTAELSDDGETFNHAVGSLGLELQGFRPAFTLRVPFGSADDVQFVYALSVLFHLH